MGVILIKKRLFFFNQDNAHFFLRYHKKNRRYQDKAQSIAPYPDNAHFCYYNAKKMGIILIKTKKGHYPVKKKMGVMRIRRNQMRLVLVTPICSYQDKAMQRARIPPI